MEHTYCHVINTSSDKTLTVLRYITESHSVANAQRCEVKHVVETELYELQYDVQIFGFSLLIIAENFIFLSFFVLVCTYSV